MVPFDGADRRADAINRHEFNGLSSWIKDIDEKMILHTTQEVRMEQRLDQLEQDVKAIRHNVETLLEIWTEAKGAMRFVTVIISGLAAGWAFVVWAKDHLKI